MLTEVQNYLKENKAGVYFHLEELWMREYQVLKDRTHPLMQNEYASSGYILHGYKVAEISNSEA